MACDHAMQCPQQDIRVCGSYNKITVHSYRLISDLTFRRTSSFFFPLFVQADLTHEVDCISKPNDLLNCSTGSTWATSPSP